MPKFFEEPIPDSPGSALRLVIDRVEPVVRRLPIVGPHVSEKSSEFYHNLTLRGLDLAGAGEETRQRAEEILGETGRPPAAVWEYRDETPPTPPGQPPDNDTMILGVFDP